MTWRRGLASTASTCPRCRRCASTLTSQVAGWLAGWLGCRAGGWGARLVFPPMLLSAGPARPLNGDTFPPSLSLHCSLHCWPLTTAACFLPPAFLPAGDPQPLNYDKFPLPLPPGAVSCGGAAHSGDTVGGVLGPLGGVGLALLEAGAAGWAAAPCLTWACTPPHAGHAMLLGLHYLLPAYLRQPATLPTPLPSNQRYHPLLCPPAPPAGAAGRDLLPGGQPLAG